MKKALVITVLASLALAVCPRLVNAAPQEGDTRTDGPVAVFRDFVETTEVQLLVSVLGKNSEPLGGLKTGAFTVYEDGEPAQITDVTEVDRSAFDGFGQADAGPPNRYVVLIFDRPSLEKRACRRILEAADAFMDRGLDSRTRLMIMAVGDRLDIIQPFTADRAEIKASLARLEEVDLGGGDVNGMKIAMRRAIRAAEPMQGGWTKPGSSGSNPMTSSGTFLGQDGAENNLGTMMAGQYQDQLAGYRDTEASRILMGLSGIEAGLRGVAGLPGRKDVVWVGQDLLVYPGLDLYTEFFNKFQAFQATANIDQPTMWAEDFHLEQQFDAVAQLAQATGAVLHVLDTADRDRLRDVREDASSFQDIYTAGDPRNMVISGGAELAGAAGVSDGALRLAVTTGGTWHGGNRNAEAFFDRLNDFTSRYYQVSYRPTGPMDGSYHRVKVEVEGAVAVACRSLVSNRSPDHHLAERAVAELSVGVGTDEMGFDLTLAANETREDGIVIQTFRLVLPTDGLVLLPAEEGKVAATVRTAVAVLGNDGQIQPPRIFPLAIALTEQQARTIPRIATSFRLALDPGTQEVAVAIADQHSGLGGSKKVGISG